MAALVIVAPVASAGVSQYAEIAPTPTSECDGGSWSSGDWYYESYPGWERSWGWTSSSEWYACEHRADLAAAGVSSNGHDVAQARVGSSASGAGSSSSWSQGEYASSTWNGSTWTSYSSAQGNTSSDSYSSGNDAVVTLANATARVADGCESSSQETYSTGYNGYSSSYYGESSSSSSSGSAWYASERERCGQSASVATGFTSVGLTNARECETSDEAFSGGWSDDHGGQGSGTDWAYARSSERCSNGLGANAGSEQVFVGERSSCSSSRSQVSNWGGQSRQRSFASDECQASEGVYGPSGLAVFTSSASWSYEYCDDGVCDSGSSQHEAVGVGHDYVGTWVIYLP